MALKVVQAEKLNDADKTISDAFSFIETTGNTLEIAGMEKKHSQLKTKAHRKRASGADAKTTKQQDALPRSI